MLNEIQELFQISSNLEQGQSRSCREVGPIFCFVETTLFLIFSAVPVVDLVEAYVAEAAFCFSVFFVAAPRSSEEAKA